MTGKRMATLLVLALGTAMSVNAQENYATWTQNRVITLNTSATGAAVTGSVVNFPVLIRLMPAESTIFAQAKPAGADIRFSKASGSPLRYQIERWDAAAKRAEIWVRVDTVLGDNSTQNIRMHWGKSDAVDSSRARAVFDTAAGFQTVYHLGDANDSIARDATINGYNATPGNTSGSNPVSIEGAIGLAKSLNTNLGSNASGAYYSIPGTNSAAPKLNFNSNADFYTISVWVKANSLPVTTGTAPRMGVVMKYGTASNQQYGILGVGNNAEPTARWSANHKSTTGEAWNEGAATIGVWQHVVAVRSGEGVGTGQTTGVLYIDGQPSALAPTGNGTSTNNGMDGDLVLGAYSNPLRFLDGALDEVTISNVARSADFVKLSYESQRYGQRFTNIGATPSPIRGKDIATRSGGARLRATAQGSGLLFALPTLSVRSRLTISDARGRTVWTRVVNVHTFSLSWDGATQAGQRTARGMYLARLTPIDASAKGMAGTVWETKVVLTR